VQCAENPKSRGITQQCEPACSFLEEGLWNQGSLQITPNVYVIKH
jgi:hypothetical protein